MLSTFSLIGQLGVLPPPPPQVVAEFLEPTPQTHSISARYNGNPIFITWNFDGRTSTLKSLRYGRFVSSSSQRRQVSAWMNMILGDVIIRLECNAQDAKIAPIESRFAGSSGARQIQFAVDNNKI